MSSPTRTARALTFAALALLPLGARATAQPAAEPALAPPPEAAFDWTQGAWEGVRRDGADGSEAPMRLWVNLILDGAGQTRELRVIDGENTYRGFSVVMLERETGRWVEQYVNDVHGRFVRLEAEIEVSGPAGAEKSVWRPVDPGRERESKLLSERLGTDGWRRTMSVSDDGGATWRVLWTDELKRRRGL